MGGTISFTLRDNSNVVHRMRRWTNVTPAFFRSPGFHSRDPDHFAEYVSGWEQMRLEWELHESGKQPLPEITMVDVYARRPGLLVPEDYGLILVLADVAEVHHMQNYVDPECVSASSLVIDLVDEENGKVDTAWWAREMARSGRLRLERVKIVDKKIERTSFTCAPDLTVDEGAGPVTVRKLVEDKRGVLNLLLDQSPWKVFRYADDRDGAAALREACRRSVGLTAEEETEWNAWMSHYEH